MNLRICAYHPGISERHSARETRILRPTQLSARHTDRVGLPDRLRSGDHFHTGTTQGPAACAAEILGDGLVHTNLRVIYILSSKYDDEGYPLRHWRGVLPSNTLNVLKHLTVAVGDSGALGPNVRVRVDIYDDTVERPPLHRIAKLHRAGNERVLVGLVGVQTNHFARATDIALALRREGVPVIIGGFHVSGILAMFETPSRELQVLLDAGVSLVKGEAEAPNALAIILADALRDELKPIYDIREFPDLSHAPVPIADAKYLRKFTNHRMATIDTSRGCPFNCSFCTIINVQGRHMRCRSAASILEALQRNYAAGIRSYFFTDDNFARSPVCDAVLEGMAVMREQGMSLEFMMQIDTRAHLIPGFVERARRAGCYMVFIGMETVNAANLEAVGKQQNDVDDYSAMVDVWHAAGAIVHVGYIIGLPYDTEASVAADIVTLKEKVKVDIASFFMLTPAPGSRDHRRMVTQNVPMDADLNNFDSLHETYRHEQMPPGHWQETYHRAWHTMYDKENIINVLLRTPTHRYRTMFWTLVWYRFAALTGVHPMFAGHIRLKDRRNRRAIFPTESRLRYARRRVTELATVARTYAQLFLEFQEIWLLTRKRNDARASVLAEMRQRWIAIQARVHECALGGRGEAAAQYMYDMLNASAGRLRTLIESRPDLSARARRRLGQLVHEIETYIADHPIQTPSRQDLTCAQDFIRDRVIAGYEELAFRFVARRRKFNAYRHDLVQRLKAGRIAATDLVRAPAALVFECALALRFGWRLFIAGHKSTEES